MTRKRVIRLVAFVLALLMPVMTATIALGSNAPQTAADATGSRYDSPDVNALMGVGEEPEDLSVSAGATYQEKAWYEYVMYSEHAVSSYRVDDNTRILFYDPYTYTNSMVIDVQFDATSIEFDTMSSYSISHTSTKTISACVESTYTDTESIQTSGRDVTHSEVQNGGEIITHYNHGIETGTSGTVKEETSYEYLPILYGTHSYTLEEVFSETIKIGTELGSDTEIGINESNTWNDEIYWATDKQTNSTIYSDDYKTSTNYVGSDTVENNTTSTTEGWTELSARITKTVGSSASTSNSWSESEGTTVTKVYAATHFASDGVTPLPWAIVHYCVQMPMKCSLQIKHSGEWVTVSTVYCLLTTVQGNCRAWMSGGQCYCEDWYSGEPVVAVDFWAQFMTKDELIKAYKDKLYPTGGVG